MALRRTFPGPWLYKSTSQGYVIEDNNGVRLAYVLADDQGGQRGIYRQDLSPDEAAHVAYVISQTPLIWRVYQMLRS
jgi:hypothetical protein